MRDAIISDTSCIILLDKIDELVLLRKLYDTVITTPEVQSEFGKKLPGWFSVKSPADKKYQKVLESTLDKGEASSIALAIEIKNSLLIIDDLKGRKFAEQLGIQVTGTLGVIVESKLAGHLKPLLKKIKTTDFRLTEELEKRALMRAGE